MIIPKKYGGLEFSAYAHSCVLVKLASRSARVRPRCRTTRWARLSWLLPLWRRRAEDTSCAPRARRGRALLRAHRTARWLGCRLDPDTGVVCRGIHDGREVIACASTSRSGTSRWRPSPPSSAWPSGSYDPEKLLGGDKTDYGITCALDPAQYARRDDRSPHFRSTYRSRTGRCPARTCSCRSTRSSAGRRWLARAGACWSSSCRSDAASHCRRTRRAVPRPAYMRPRRTPRIRKQFAQPVGRFEGVEAALTRMAGAAYIIDAARSVTDRRHRRRREAVGAGGDAQVPLHRTRPQGSERRHGRAGRQGHLPRAEELPRPRLPGGAVAITVEGANILTRSLMILGRGRSAATLMCSRR